MDMTHFNPQSQDENDFLATFVARQAVLDFFLRQLQLLEPARPGNHHLIIAPRGYGKTSLLRRIAIAVRTEPALNVHLIPLSFREEQHNVISLDIFWRNCLQSLLEIREDEGAPNGELVELEAAWDKHAPRQALRGEDQDGEPAKQTFNQYCARLGRRPLLLIDNLDTLLAGLPTTHQWSLRNDLQASGGPMLIAAASRYPESTHDQKSAFYDFFRIQTLNRLSDDEVLRCLRVRAEHRGEPGKKVLFLLDNNPGRVSALNTLAGGNPRTLGVLYSVLESQTNVDILKQLQAMLDTFTGWYQARTEELPIQSRAVFDALALNWDPMTAAKLGEATGLDTPAVSSQLTRLEKAGYVESVSLNARKKGRSGYQVSERFFNIWYLMRNGPRRTLQSIRFLTVFLESCFSPRERLTIARSVLQDGRADPGYALALASSMRGSGTRNRLLDLASHESDRVGRADEYMTAIESLRQVEIRESLSVEPAVGNSLKLQGKSLEAIEADISHLSRATGHSARENVARALVSKGITLRKLRKSADAIRTFESLVERFGEAPEAALREAVAQALISKAITLGELGKPEEEIRTYDAMVERFGEATEAVLREAVARVLVNKGVTLAQLGKPKDAIRTYDTVVERFGEAKEAALRKQVAMALVNKGITLGELGKPEDEIRTYDAIVERFGEAKEAALREQLAMALVNKGITLVELGKPEDAIRTFDTVVERLGEATEAVLRQLIARALVNKGITLARLGKPEDAIHIFDTVVERLGKATEAVLREAVARVLVNKGVALAQLGKPEDAIRTYDTVVERFGEATEAVLREAVARVLVNKGVTLAQIGKPEDAIRTYDTVVERFGEAPEAVLREAVARALFNKGVALGELGKPEDEIRTYDTVVDRLGEAPEAALREAVAQALVNKGITLGQIGKPEDAIRTYDTVVERFGEATEAALREQVVRALFNKGVALGELGKPEDAIRTFDSVVEQFGEAKEAVFRKQVAMALVNNGITLGQLGKPEDAIRTYDTVVERFGEAKEAALREQVAMALVNKGITLGELGKPEDEIRTYDAIVERFGEAKEAALREQLAIALVNKGITLGEVGKPEDAIRTFDTVVEQFGEAKEAALRRQVAMAMGSSGNLYLDVVGDPARAQRAYESGLVIDLPIESKAHLHANLAFALALHADMVPEARMHISSALESHESISKSGRDLLNALSSLGEPLETRWQRVFDHILKSVERSDEELWKVYLDDLQRLLWYVIAQEKGADFLVAMNAQQIQTKFAPLYHAFAAAIEGEDYLLKINPETRQPALRIYEGLARRLRLYPKKGKSKTLSDS